MRIKHMMSHASIWLLTAVFLFGVVATIQAPTPWVWLVIPIGVLAQFLNEYAIHRFVFHQKPPKSQWAFNLLYQLHYGHHDFPSKPGLFFVPLWFVVPMLAFDFGIAWAAYFLLGFPHPLYFAISTICIGGAGVFLVYEWFHMTAHVQTEKTTVEKYVTRLHGRHHFSNFNTLYHVSPGGVLIDRLMGTDYDEEKAKAEGRMAFLRTLQLQPDDPRLVSARQTYASKYDLSEQEIDVAAKR